MIASQSIEASHRGAGVLVHIMPPPVLCIDPFDFNRCLTSV